MYSMIYFSTDICWSVQAINIKNKKITLRIAAFFMQATDLKDNAISSKTPPGIYFLAAPFFGGCQSEQTCMKIWHEH